ncbi:MAG: GPP34 family phosphoprotein [Verrucomicrobiota bacterium]
MLRFAEEITLLSLNDETGVMHRNVSRRSYDYAIAGALIMELAFLNRLDTDAEHIIMLKDMPAGDPLLDEALKILSGMDENPPITAAIEVLAARSASFEPRIFAALVHKGILEEREKRFLWMKGERTYPVIDGKEETEVLTRIRMTVLAEDAIPDPQDVAIIALMEATKLHRVVFLRDELSRCRRRIHQLAQMDFIGQGIANALDKAAGIIEEPEAAAES